MPHSSPTAPSLDPPALLAHLRDPSERYVAFCPERQALCALLGREAQQRLDAIVQDVLADVASTAVPALQHSRNYEEYLARLAEAVREGEHGLRADRRLTRDLSPDEVTLARVVRLVQFQLVASLEAQTGVIGTDI